jgi:alkylhydroperoxidase family enzyme
MSALSKTAQWVSKRRFGQELGPVDAMEPNGRVLMGYAMFESLLERSKKMDESLKHLAVMKTAAMVGCEWCIDFGSMLHHEHGLPDQQLTDLPNFRESDAFSEDEKLVLEYAETLASTPAGFVGEIMPRLRERWSEAEIVELTANIAIESFRARFNHAFGVAPQGFAKGAACAIPERPPAQAASV